jgi:hypothetical protein
MKALTKLLDIVTEYPFIFYTLAMVLLAVYLVSKGVDCDNSPLTCMALLVK